MQIDLAYLPLLMEEAAEVIQAAAKIQRFGENRAYPSGKNMGKTNVEVLALEVGDLLEIISRLNLPASIIEQGRQHKCKQLIKWGPQITMAQLDAACEELRRL